MRINHNSDGWVKPLSSFFFMVTVKVLLASGGTALEEVHLELPEYVRSLRLKVKQALPGLCF